MEKNIDAISINDDENRALQEYQDNYYKIVNTLLRKGITSEQTINSKNGSDYIAPSNEELEAAIDNIKNIYSAIIKRTLANEDNKETRPLYRGTQISIVEKMKESAEETAFLSTTTRKNQTRTFSRTFSKDKSVDKEADKALLKVEGDVPYINMEDVLGGMEDEILFAPAKAEIIDGIEGISPDDERHTNLYGKAYTLKLTPLEIPEMSDEEISKLKVSIFNRNEEMGKTINDILEIQKYPELFDTNQLPALIEKYSNWKDDVISYCHQQFRQIKKEIENEYKTVNTQKLGKETIDINEDVKRVDEVEKQMKEQMREHTKQREEKNQKSNDDNAR